VKRPSKALSSAVAPAITSYLALKRALGRRFTHEAATLAHLDRFLAAQRPAARAITPANFATWSLTLAHLTPTVRRNRMRIVRNLCLYVRRLAPGCFPMCQLGVRQFPLEIYVPMGGEWWFARAQANESSRSRPVGRRRAEAA